MSMLLMVKAMETKVGNPLRKLVLIKLADNANDKGECWPSYQHIADQCEISRRSVINHIKDLVEAGFLRVVHRKGEHKPNASNIYIISFDGAGAALPPSAGDSPASAGDSPPHGAGAAPRTSHSFEPVKEPKPLVELKHDDAAEAINYLNAVAGRNYKPVPSNLKLLNARFSEGYTLDDVKAVIDRKYFEWFDDSKMNQFLRPSTLFNAEKFNQYAGQLSAPMPEKNLGAGHAKHQSNYIMSAQEAAEYIAAEQRQQQFCERSGNTYEHGDGC